MICKSHKCRKDFTPTNHRARFCSKSCKISHADWVKTRGGVIVNLMLSNPPDLKEQLMEKRDALLKEFNNTP